MAILAECDICGSQHRVKDAMIGSSIRCKDCGVQFVVPQGPSISAETYFEVQGRLRLREPDDVTSRFWPRLVAAFVTFLVIGSLIGAVWAFRVLLRPDTQKNRRHAAAPRACTPHSDRLKSPMGDVVQEPSNRYE